MVYKRLKTTGYKYFLCCGIFLCQIIGCAEKKDINSSNIFYLELINFSDSLSQYISSNTFGKATFHKNNKLEIISVNYITEIYPDMHFLKNIPGDKKEIKEDAKKIRIELIQQYSVDSIRYSLQKFIYRNKQWNKISDMGVLKGFTTYKKAKEFYISELGNQIIDNTVAYTYE